MPAKIIIGTELARRRRAEMKERVAALKVAMGRVPRLAVIVVGDDAANLSYVAGKAKAAAEIGIRQTTLHHTASITESELLEIVASLNADIAVDGILVQLPLPEHIDERRIIAAIDRAKDVDGLQPLNVGALWHRARHAGMLPCTPRGIIELLKAAEVELAGKEAVVVGRSDLVGLPVAKLLLDEQATVTMAHSHTESGHFHGHRYGLTGR